MSGSEIKIKRRDMMSVEEVVSMLRRLADTMEEGHSFTLDGLPIMMANQLLVRQEYKKEGLENKFTLILSWDEEMIDQPKLGDEHDQTGVDDSEDLTDPDVPTPLDLPGSEDRPRLRADK